MGSPHRGCKTFGSAERIRLPIPAANITQAVFIGTSSQFYDSIAKSA
jgi:hypothetical protein